MVAFFDTRERAQETLEEEEQVATFSARIVIVVKRNTRRSHSITATTSTALLG